MRLDNKSFAFGLVAGVLLSIAVLAGTLTLTLLRRDRTGGNPPPRANTVVRQPTTTVQNPVNITEVLPPNYRLGVSFGDAVTKMVAYGAIDKDKFIKLYGSRAGGLTDEQRKILEEPSAEELVISENNAGLLLNLFWPLGISNKTGVLAEGPMGTQYKDRVGNFASTGGWSLGKESGGRLFNRFAIVPLNPEQEATVAEIAKAIYRPCCGNSTYFPDCNHGAAMLGFIELAVAQGLSKEEIYEKALVLNSYWFPQTYAELAAYFQIDKKTAWKDVDPKVVLGSEYSSLNGYRAISGKLQAEGVLPQVKGGGGCGV